MFSQLPQLFYTRALVCLVSVFFSFWNIILIFKDSPLTQHWYLYVCPFVEKNVINVPPQLNPNQRDGINLLKPLIKTRGKTNTLIYSTIDRSNGPDDSSNTLIKLFIETPLFNPFVFGPKIMHEPTINFLNSLLSFLAMLILVPETPHCDWLA